MRERGIEEVHGCSAVHKVISEGERPVVCEANREACIKLDTHKIDNSFDNDLVCLCNVHTARQELRCGTGIVCGLDVV